MRTNGHSWEKVFLTWVVMLWVLSGAATAADVNVNCPPFVAGPGEYPNVQAALNALDLVGPHTITVKGNCVGRAFIGDGITGRRNISIVAAEGETATMEPAAAGQGRGAVIVVCGAQDIYLERLTLRNARFGLQLCDDAEVDTTGLTMENNAAGGVQLSGNSVLFFVDQTVIRNNGESGIQVLGGSRLFIFGFTAGGGVTTVEGHPLWGIQAAPGAMVEIRGPHQIRGNGTAGNPASGGMSLLGSQALVVSNTLGNPSINNNPGAGIVADTGSSISLTGTTVSDNGGHGIDLQLLSVAKLVSGNSVSGNGGGGIACDESSWAGGNLTGIATLGCAKVKK